MSYDIGDDVTITTSFSVNGALVDPASVALSVTAPDGDVSTPSVAHPSVGQFEAVVLATAAGRWRYTWTTTGPAGIEHGLFDVEANPPPPGRLDPLATPDDLADRLGRDLTEAEARKAPSLLADASALVRAYTRQNFDLTVDDSVVLRPVGTSLRLPQRPVLGVTSVSGVGAESTPDVPLSGWVWDGIDKVNVDGLGGVVLNLPEWWGEGFGANTYRVVYDHGYPTSPDDVVAVVCGMTNRVLLAPSPVEGMTSEQIGQYRYQMGGSAGAQVRLAQADKDALDAAGYRRKAGTIQLRT